jgi:hypothetical protein
MQIYFGWSALWYFNVAKDNASIISGAIFKGGANFGEGLDGRVPSTCYYTLVSNVN